MQEPSGGEERMRSIGWAAPWIMAWSLAACRVEVQPEDGAAEVGERGPVAAEAEARVPEPVLEAQATAMAAQTAVARGDWATADAATARLLELREPIAGVAAWGDIMVRYDHAVDSLAVRVQRRDQPAALQSAEATEAAVSEMMRRYGVPGDVGGLP